MGGCDYNDDNNNGMKCIGDLILLSVQGIVYSVTSSWTDTLV